MSDERIKPEVLARLEHEADLVAQRTRYKQLGAELGLSPKYISNYISRRVREKRKVNVAITSS